MAVVIVVGVQWGDEGKGKIVDLLTEKARFVVRWAGGANAGHTLVVEGKKYVTRLIPSGVLREGVTCVLGEGMVIDPAVLVDEIRTFRAQGFISGARDLIVADRAHLTLPHHLEIDRLREEKGGGLGTTKKGIGPTYESKASRVALRVGDLLRPERFRTRLEAQIAAYAPYLREMGGSVPNPTEITQRYMALAEEIRPFVGDASRVIHDAVVRRDNVLFEGAQGVLLDIDHGTFPFVTSSSTTAGGACAALGIGPTKIDRVLGVAKGYATRVGTGPFPTELNEDVGELLRKRGNEFGSVTGRPRRCGWLDVAAVRLAVRLSGIEALALTKLDVMAGLDHVRLCTGYRLAGRTLDEMPADLDGLATAEPIFEDLPGWPELSGPAIPPAAAAFVDRVSALVGIPVWATSWGPGRLQTIVTQDPFGSPFSASSSGPSPTG